MSTKISHNHTVRPPINNDRVGQPTDQSQLQQQLVALLVMAVMQQIKDAISQEKNGQNKVDEPKGNECAGGADGAGKAKGKGGNGIEGILQQFLQLLKLISQLMGKGGEDSKASGLAEQLAGVTARE